jgi:hypothetical protein
MSVDTFTNGNGNGVADAGPEPTISIELGLEEAEAFHAWLLKASADGVASLDDPQVSATLAQIGRSLEDVHVVMNMRRELAEAGVSAAHLSDEQVRDLGRRISQTVTRTAG